MSAAAPILICPQVQLQRLPDAERDVLRRFFTEHVRGMDAVNDKRWRRFVRDLFNAQAGEGFQLYRVEERGGPYHRRHRVILQRLFDSQDRFKNIDRLHDYLKYGAGFVEWAEGRQPGVAWPRPRSTSFDTCSEDDMHFFHEAAIEFLHSDRAQRFLWRQVRAKDRHLMLEAVLRNPNDQQENGNG
jgi:hypothetical protein